jgi:hypothetical protein
MPLGTLTCLAHHRRHVARVGRTLKQRQAEMPRVTIKLARRSQVRLPYRHLAGRFGPRGALTAIARELAGS